MKKGKMTKKYIEELASLSKINLTKEEVEKFSNQMQTIITSVETLNDFEEKTGYDIKNVKFSEIEFNQLREDEVGKSMTQEDVLANAPYQEKGYFKVYGDIFDEDGS